MSAAAAATDAAPPKKGKKKLILIIAIVVVLLAVAGAAAAVMMKKKAAAAEEDGDGDGEAAEQVEHKTAAKHDPKHPPTFVPLDPFTVNLADREAERYAQIGVTLQIDDAHAADEIKAYMPAIRNNILMLLAHKTSATLLEREGKERLAAEIRREASKPLGIEIELDDADGGDAHAAAGDEEKPKKKKKKKAAEPSPIVAVQFSNFIIQ